MGASYAYEIEKQINILQSELEEYESEYDGIRHQIEELENESDQVEGAINKLEDQIAILEEQLDKAAEEADPDYRNPEWYVQKESLFDFDENGELIDSERLEGETDG